MKSVERKRISKRHEDIFSLHAQTKLKFGVDEKKKSVDVSEVALFLTHHFLFDVVNCIVP